MLSITADEIQKIKEIMANFIWDDKTPKVKHSAMIAEYEHGGLKYPNIDALLNAQKIMWVKRYFCSPYHPWKLIFECHLEKNRR